MIESTDALAIVCLVAVALTPLKRRKRFSRIQWSAYTERADVTAGESPRDPRTVSGVPRSAYAFARSGGESVSREAREATSAYDALHPPQIGSVEAALLPVPSPGESPFSSGHNSLDAA